MIKILDDVGLTYLWNKIKNKITSSIANKVDKSGDTMTGDLTIQKTAPSTIFRSTNRNAAPGQTIPDSGESAIGNVAFYDNQSSLCGWVRLIKNSADRLYSSICTLRTVNGTEVFNQLRVGVNADGTRYVYVSEAEPWRNALNVVSKSGDSVNGDFHFKSSNIKHGTVPSEQTYGNAKLYFHGSDDNVFGQIRPFSDPNGYDGINIITYRPISGSNVFNSLVLSVDDSGNRRVSVTESAPWRSALGLAKTSWGTNKVAAYAKQGDVVTLTYSGTTTDAEIPAGIWTQVATIPTGYRPPRNIYSTVGFGSNKDGYIRLNSSGTLSVLVSTLTGAIPANNAAYFNMSFVI